MIDNFTINLFRYPLIETAVARLHVKNWDLASLCSDCGEAAVRVTQNEKGSRFPLASFVFVMVRYLYVTNGLPCKPGRSCANNTGEPSSIRIRIATIRSKGLNMVSAHRAAVKSKKRLTIITRPKSHLTPFGSPFDFFSESSITCARQVMPKLPYRIQELP